MHVTGDDGQGVAVPLNRAALEQLGTQCAAALAVFKGPDKGKAWWRLARAVAEGLGDLANGKTEKEKKEG